MISTTDQSQERNSKIVSVVEGSDAGQYISEEYDEELDASVAKSPMPVDADAKVRARFEWRFYVKAIDH
jgi:hypothetical protein